MGSDAPAVATNGAAAETTTYPGDVHIQGNLTVDGVVNAQSVQFQGDGWTWTLYLNPDGSFVISDKNEGVRIQQEGPNGNPPMAMFIHDAPVKTGS
jgi:hypothetical protein